MKNRLFIWLTGCIGLFSCEPHPCTVHRNALRAPAYPLVTIDPYTSGWSFSDKLYDSPVKHWTGRDFPLIGALKADGEVYRFMGAEDREMDCLIPVSENSVWTARFTTRKPDDRWRNADFDDADWTEGEGAFGTDSEATVRTQWSTEDIWIRRTVEIDEISAGNNLYLMYSNDDGAEFYINGIKAFETGNRCNKNAVTKLTDEAVNALRTGENVIAVHCNNWVGDGLIDFGILAEKEAGPVLVQTAEQTSADVQAMQTRYSFTCGPVDLTLTFTAPLFMDEPELLSRPVNYISYDVRSNDGREHEVEIYFEASPAWSLDHPYQQSVSRCFEKNGLMYLNCGSTAQHVLAKKGDDVRIDWGYFYLAGEKENTVCLMGDGHTLRAGFAYGNLRGSTSGSEAGDSRLAMVRRPGRVKECTGQVMIGYDDIYSVQYFGENLRPYWNRTGTGSITTQFEHAARDYARLMKRCCKFDARLMEEATAAGGEKYAALCALAYRQAISAHKLLQAPNGDLLFLSKENFSNGSIGTVDITYPSMPLFLYYNPDLGKGLLNHIFYYSKSGKWKKPFPAHDIGTYPLANGQTYGGDMPVEESGNMLILTAAIAMMEGNAGYALQHWDVLTTWADYLAEKGLDPENQLCTDDFAGHFAHNTNLSVKAILGVASYGYLAGAAGKESEAEQYTEKARNMALEWVKMADDGDHYRLTFDQPGSWSQKYNLVWDKLLKLDIFPEEVAPKEIASYLNRQNKYGLPLDSRAPYTKSDWIIWTATLGADKAEFERFVDPLYLFMNETADRVPMPDWIYTDRPYHQSFRARSVVGGYFIKMLEEKLK